MSITLPAFPVDEGTLALLMAALDPWSHGHSEAERSSLDDFLTLMSEMGGSDTESVEDQISEDTGRMRDPRYSPNCVIVALVEEIRRLRRTGT